MKLLYSSVIIFSLVAISTGCSTTAYIKTSEKKTTKPAVVVWQPSHQTDTGNDYNESAVCNAIVNYAIATPPKLNEFKVWSIGVPNLHHADSGSNTKIEHTSAIIDGKISGYAYEIQQANKHHPLVFIGVHNNGGTNKHAVWGYVHEGDKYEVDNRALAERLVAAICAASDLENRGIHGDSSTGRNDYRCKTTGKLAFYSLDENVNHTPYRVLLEIGDNAVSRSFLLNPENQQKLGAAIKTALVEWLSQKNKLL